VEVETVRTVEVPTRIVHGAGAIARVGELVADLGVTRTPLVSY
jgi:choline dehydrogenase